MRAEGVVQILVARARELDLVFTDEALRTRGLAEWHAFAACDDDAVREVGGGRIDA